MSETDKIILDLVSGIPKESVEAVESELEHLFVRAGIENKNDPKSMETAFVIMVSVISKDRSRISTLTAEVERLKEHKQELRDRIGVRDDVIVALKAEVERLKGENKRLFANLTYYECIVCIEGGFTGELYAVKDGTEVAAITPQRFSNIIANRNKREEKYKTTILSLKAENQKLREGVNQVARMAYAKGYHKGEQEGAYNPMDRDNSQPRLDNVDIEEFLIRIGLVP